MKNKIIKIEPPITAPMDKFMNTIKQMYENGQLINALVMEDTNIITVSYDGNYPMG